MNGPGDKRPSFRQETPANDQCLAGAPVVLANAERLLHSSKHLGTARQYAPAVALLVLAGEEALKALTLYMVGIGVPFPPRTFESILRGHPKRHALAAFTMLVPFIARQMNLMGSTVLEHHLPELTLEEQTRWGEILQHISRQPLGPDEDHNRKVLRWWLKADELKQRALYVDYKDKHWLSPDSITEDDFIVSLAIVEYFVWLAKACVSAWGLFPGEVQTQLLAWIKDACENLEKGQPSPSQSDIGIEEHHVYTLFEEIERRLKTM